MKKILIFLITYNLCIANTLLTESDLFNISSPYIFEMQDGYKVFFNKKISISDDYNLSVISSVDYKNGEIKLHNSKDDIDNLIKSNRTITNFTMTNKDNYVFSTLGDSSKINLYINDELLDVNLKGKPYIIIKQENDITLIERKLLSYRYSLTKGKGTDYKGKSLIPIHHTSFFKERIGIIDINDPFNAITTNHTLNNNNVSLLNVNDGLYYLFSEDNHLKYFDVSNFKFNDLIDTEFDSTDDRLSTVYLGDIYGNRIFIISSSKNKKPFSYVGRIINNKLNIDKEIKLDFNAVDFDMIKNSNGEVVFSYVKNNKIYLKKYPNSYFTRNSYNIPFIYGYEKDLILDSQKTLEKNNNFKILDEPKIKDDFSKVNLDTQLNYTLNKGVSSNVNLDVNAYKYNKGNLGISFNIGNINKNINFGLGLYNYNKISNFTISEKLKYVYINQNDTVKSEYNEFKIYNHFNGLLSNIYVNYKIDLNKKLSISPSLSLTNLTGRKINYSIFDKYLSKLDIENKIQTSNKLEIETNLKYDILNNLVLEVNPGLSFYHTQIENNKTKDNIIDLKLTLNTGLQYMINNHFLSFNLNTSHYINTNDNKIGFNFNYQY